MSDVISILGNSECEVVSCVDIKELHIILSDLLRKAKSIVEYYHILVVPYIDMKFFLWVLHVHHKYGWIISL